MLFGRPLVSHLVGHGPNDLVPYAVSETLEVDLWMRVPDTNTYRQLGPLDRTMLADRDHRCLASSR